MNQLTLISTSTKMHAEITKALKAGGLTPIRFRKDAFGISDASCSLEFAGMSRPRLVLPGGARIADCISLGVLSERITREELLKNGRTEARTQIRFVALLEAGTYAPLAAQFGPLTSGETTPARTPLRRECCCRPTVVSLDSIFSPDSPQPGRIICFVFEPISSFQFSENSNTAPT